KRVMRALQQDVANGTPIVVLEPSCASVFRDELVNLFPEDPIAQKLSKQTYLLSEFLSLPSSPAAASRGSISRWMDPRHRHSGVMAKNVILQTHCHQKSVLSGSSDREWLERLGL